VVNAGNRETDLAWFKAHLPPEVSLADLSDDTYMIAVQGPRAVELLDQACDGTFERSTFVSLVPRAHMGGCTINGVNCMVGRTGYTGEDGVELYCKSTEAEKLWNSILEKAQAEGIEAGPVGLAARDSLRFEAGMPLHGHEISPEIRPQEALLNWACDFEKDFIGKEALLKLKAEGLKRKLVTINVTGGVPREGCALLDKDGKEIGDGHFNGVCVAGMFCPTTGTYSANAFVPPEYAKTGTPLKVLIRGNAKDAVVVKRPLYVPVYRR
jgi:glycine cleavage system T protein